MNRKTVLTIGTALLIFGAIFYFSFARYFMGTSAVRSAGGNIYARLQQAEKDVRADKVVSSSDPEIAGPQQEIDKMVESQAHASFDDSMLYGDLSSYASMVGTLADINKSMADGSANTQAARRKIDHAINVEKKEIEGYLSSRFKVW